MGKTAFQKIVDVHLRRTLPDGRLVLGLDWVWGHEITTPNAILDAQMRGCDVVFDPRRIKTMIDHVNPAKDTASAVQGKIVREWSAKHGIEFLDVGRNGVCHAVIPENGWILPGNIGIMGDSHTCTHGAFCALSAGVGTTELETGIITGLWVCPPQKVIRVNFVGKLPPNVFAKDLILTLIKRIGVKGATNAILEFGGSVVDAMSMEARMTMTNMAVEAGATSGMVMFDQTTADYLSPVIQAPEKVLAGISAIVTMRALRSFNSDPDAVYDQTVEIDVSGLVPVVTNNTSPGDVVAVSELSGKPINQVYIGSCTNGRIEDLRQAASIFRRFGNVAEGVRCIVVPATQNIYRQALDEGLLEVFLEAGCFVSGPTCGACLGMSCGVIAPGEVCVSTTNRNFPGRMGAGGTVHLASPHTAAFAAVQGKIAELPAFPAEDDGWLDQTPTAVPTGWSFQGTVTRPDYPQLLGRVRGGEVKNFSGKAFYLPDANVDTDQIIPAKYLTETDKDALGKHCLEDAKIAPADRPKIFSSQILVAGENFGCGSSREHAPWALIGAGIRCVIAPSFARIFENNMFANGLLCITLPKPDIDVLFRDRPETINVDWEKREISMPGVMGWTGVFLLSDYQKDMIRNGGSVGVMLKLAAELQQQGNL